MNVGGIVDSTWFAKDDAVNAVLMAWRGGMEEDLRQRTFWLEMLFRPGKLVDTFAQRLEDYRRLTISMNHRHMWSIRMIFT